MILCIIDLFQFQLTNLFSVNSIFDFCLHQWWKDSGQVNRRNTTHFRRSDSSTESREAASHLQICGVCQVKGDFANLHALIHSLPIMPTGAQGSNKGPPQLSFLGQLLGGAPAVTQAPHLCLSSMSRCIFGSAPLAQAYPPVSCGVPSLKDSLLHSDFMTYPSLRDKKQRKLCIHSKTNKVSRVIHRVDSGYRYLVILFRNQDTPY